MIINHLTICARKAYNYMRSARIYNRVLRLENRLGSFQYCLIVEVSSEFDNN